METRMTFRERVEIAWFGAALVIGLPASIAAGIVIGG